MSVHDSFIACTKIVDVLAKRILKRYKTRKYTIMELTRIIDESYKKLGFIKWGYMAKNTARYLAMTYPQIICPESIVLGGPGHYAGLSFIFNYKPIASGIKIKARLENGNLIPNDDFKTGIWFIMMGILFSETKHIYKRQNFLNNEDKVCFFYKYKLLQKGKRKTLKFKKNIIFPNWFKL
mgnify:CR=1 FL=1